MITVDITVNDEGKVTDVIMEVMLTMVNMVMISFVLESAVLMVVLMRL